MRRVELLFQLESTHNDPRSDPLRFGKSADASLAEVAAPDERVIVVGRDQRVPGELICGSFLRVPRVVGVVSSVEVITGASFPEGGPPRGKAELDQSPVRREPSRRPAEPGALQLGSKNEDNSGAGAHAFDALDDLSERF